MLRELVQRRIQEALQSINVSAQTIEVTVPEKPEFGDLSSNIAFALKSHLKEAPRAIAEEIVAHLDKTPFEKVEVVGPGFLNFFLKPETVRQALREILAQGSAYGKLSVGQGKRAQVEFVSANPTGPLTIGHCRQAVLGDVISRLLENAGYEVTREYYFNDAGRQMRLLGESVKARYLELLGQPSHFPEEGYHGEYIYEIARAIQNRYGTSWAEVDSEQFKELAEAELFAEIKRTLSRLYRVLPERAFDVYYNESWLYQASPGRYTVPHSGTMRELVLVNNAQVLEWLRELDLAYEKDGAIWFKATALGRPQDRVLVRSHTGEPTYRLPDMAYHVNKLLRGFDLIIDIFGADHQETYQDVVAAVRALQGKLPPECDPDKIRVLIHQWVNLSRGGRPVKMSKRMATFVTIDELIDEIKQTVELAEQSDQMREDFAVNVVRYFILARSPDSHVHFDLDLAKKQSKDNPVYYVMYAYTRIGSILEKSEVRSQKLEVRDFSALREPAELSLIKKLDEFPQIVQDATEHLAPHFLSVYVHELAGIFHDFYEKHRVIDETNPELMQARLALVRAVQLVLERAFGLLGLKAPESM